jgi:acetyl esterase/lipase
VKRIDDVVYAATLLADLYLPAAETLAPVIVWLHGGGWRFGDRRLAPDLTRYFTSSGFAMVSIDYRLSGEAVFPAPVEDVKTAVRWVRANAARYGFDPRRIGLWGSSAGGHLAMLAALSEATAFEPADKLYAEHSSEVQAVVNGYGPVDFLRLDAHRALLGPPVNGAVCGDPLTADAADSFESRLMGAPVQTCLERVRGANPITYVRRSAPPALILHGAEDRAVPHQQSTLLYEAMAAHDCDVTLCVTSGLGHGFLNNNDFDRETGRTATVRQFQPGVGERISADPPASFQMIEAFFRKHLTKELDR